MEAKVKERTAELEETIARLRKAENRIRAVREQHRVVNTIKTILKDKQYIDPSLAEKLVDDIETEIAAHKPPHETLSNQEYKVMIMIASGMGIKDIGKEIYLSTSTVGTYRVRILDKLNLKTTAEIIRYAIKNNLTD